jgi:transglutaminase-like putative cysteine protease
VLEVIVGRAKAGRIAYSRVFVVGRIKTKKSSMDFYPNPPFVPLDLSVRVGCKLQYETAVETPMLLNLKARHDAHQFIARENLNISPPTLTTQFEDDHGNYVTRLSLQPGTNTFIYDAIANVPAVAENFAHTDHPIPPQRLPANLLRYTLPSRYCDSDRLRDFAWEKFGTCRQGIERVQAICDWLHKNIEYRTGSGSSEIAAQEVIQRGYGVCRDFAHCGVALCRTFNLPARYVSGFLPDIACYDPGTPQDFHAYFEVYMGGRWQPFDARFNTPRTGRIRIAAGYDAATCAFSTFYGAANLTWFEVWTYQVDPMVVRLGDPVDLTKRLCGSPQIRRTGAAMASAA